MFWGRMVSAHSRGIVSYKRCRSYRGTMKPGMGSSSDLFMQAYSALRGRSVEGVRYLGCCEGTFMLESKYLYPHFVRTGKMGAEVGKCGFGVTMPRPSLNCAGLEVSYVDPTADPLQPVVVREYHSTVPTLPTIAFPQIEIKFILQRGLNDRYLCGRVLGGRHWYLLSPDC